MPFLTLALKIYKIDDLLAHKKRMPGTEYNLRHRASFIYL